MQKYAVNCSFFLLYMIYSEQAGITCKCLTFMTSTGSKTNGLKLWLYGNLMTIFIHLETRYFVQYVGAAFDFFHCIKASGSLILDHNFQLWKMIDRNVLLSSTLKLKIKSLFGKCWVVGAASELLKRKNAVKIAVAFKELFRGSIVADFAKDEGDKLVILNEGYFLRGILSFLRGILNQQLLHIHRNSTASLQLCFQSCHLELLEKCFPAEKSAKLDIHYYSMMWRAFFMCCSVDSCQVCLFSQLRFWKIPQSDFF